MTLKDFAHANGINYQTAKTWLHRGKIREVSPGEFQLSETTLKPETLVSTPETLKPENVPSGFHLKPETKVSTPETCAGCETLRAELASLADRVATLEAQTPPDWGAEVRKVVQQPPRGAIDPPSTGWGA